MAYVPKAKRDVFISYPIEVEAWAQHFEQDLRQELEHWIPASELRIYLGKRDWQLAPSDEMLREAGQSAFFIATLVPGALSNDGLRFFQQEWAAFGKSAELFGSVESRFAPVQIKEVDSRRITQFFTLANQESFWRSFEFYFKDNSGVPHTLARDSRYSIYKEKIEEVAWQIKQRLMQLKEQMAPGNEQHASAVAAKGPFAGMKVVLGEQDGQLENERAEIRQLLLNDGVELIGGTYADDHEGLRQILLHDLEQADLFVQLLDPLAEAACRVEARGNVPAEGLKSRAQLSYECALDHLKAAYRPFAILQWRDPKIIRGALTFWPEELLDSAHVQAVGLQQFKQAIRAKLQDLRKPPPPAPTGKPFVFITADQADLDLAGELAEAALDHADVDVLTDTEENRREHFTDAMRLAAAIIILHGKAPVQFVRNWLSLYVREKAKLKRTSRFDALYRAPPPKQLSEEPRLPSRDLRILGSEELFTVDGLEQLCRELGGVA